MSAAFNLKAKTHTIRSISSEETYPVRHPVLRKGRPLESSRFDNDDLESSFHLGLFLDEKLVGVATFLKNEHTLFSEEDQYQLRGMAVLEAYQGHSIGKNLMLAGEQRLNDINAERLWFNARIIAVDFYKKLGYQTVGERFEIAGVGDHYIMTKLL